MPVHASAARTSDQSVFIRGRCSAVWRLRRSLFRGFVSHIGTKRIVEGMLVLGPETFESRLRFDQLFEVGIGADPKLLGSRSIDVLIVQVFPGIEIA
jgi:hypothetical protein